MKPRVITWVAITGGFLGQVGAGALAVPPADGPVIHNVAADVFRYWDGAKDLSAEEKYQAWVGAIEDPHRVFYDTIIFGGMGGPADAAARRAMVDRFLATLPARIEGLRACAGSMDKEIRSTYTRLRASFPGFPAAPEYYLAVSLGTSDGGVRPLAGRFICYFGVDVVSDRTEVRRQALITHESMHLYQFSRLMPTLTARYGDLPLFELIPKMGVGPMLFIEGQAIRATEELCPDAGLYAVYEQLIPDIRKKMPQLVDGLLAARDVLSMDVYKKYFADPNEDPFVPEKAAYYMGYLIVKELEKQTSLDEMFQWDLDTLNARMISGLVALRNGPSVAP